MDEMEFFWLVIGLLVGANFGVFVVCLCRMAGDRP